MNNKQIKQFIKSTELSNVIESLDPNARCLYEKGLSAELKDYLTNSYHKNPCGGLGEVLCGASGLSAISSLFAKTLVDIPAPYVVLMIGPLLTAGFVLMIYDGLKRKEYDSFDNNINSLINSVKA